MRRRKQATETDPKFTLAYAGWGDVLAIIGDDIDAEAKHQTVFEISPHFREHSMKDINGFLERHEPIP